MAIKKKTIRWFIAFILLIVIIIVADLVVHKTNKVQAPNSLIRLKKEQIK